MGSNYRVAACGMCHVILDPKHVKSTPEKPPNELLSEYRLSRGKQVTYKMMH